MYICPNEAKLNPTQDRTQLQYTDNSRLTTGCLATIQMYDRTPKKLLPPGFKILTSTINTPLVTDHILGTQHLQLFAASCSYAAAIYHVFVGQRHLLPISSKNNTP